MCRELSPLVKRIPEEVGASWTLPIELPKGCVGVSLPKLSYGNDECCGLKFGGLYEDTGINLRWRCSVGGKHTVKVRAKTQSLIAQSSGGAELYGTVRGSCEGPGLQSLYHDFGASANIKAHLDANAGKGIVEGQGLCKVLHVDVQHLWLLQQQGRRILPLTKVFGTLNPADMMTKNLAINDIMKYMGLLNVEMPEGRSKAAAKSV